MELNQQSRLLADVVDQLMKESKLTNLNELDSILITNGPGSFTGIRIGLSFVLGLKEYLNCDVYSCNTFCALDIDYKPGKSIITLNAGRDIFYCQDYDSELPATNSIKLMTRDDLESLNHDQIAILGHYTNPNATVSTDKMINLFKDIGLRDILFSNNLEPLYIKESYF